MKWFTVFIFFFALVLIASAADEQKSTDLKPATTEVKPEEAKGKVCLEFEKQVLNFNFKGKKGGKRHRGRGRKHRKAARRAKARAAKAAKAAAAQAEKPASA